MTRGDRTPVAGVAGLGLIGCSAGLALKEAGYRVVGYDTDPRHACEATAIGAVDETATSLSSLASKQPQVVFVAVPPANVEATARALLATGVIVSDVCSVKSPIVDALGSHPRFLGGHPLAGAAASGPRGARADLFAGAHWVLTPGQPGPDTVAAVFAAVRAVGAEPVIMDAARHDEAVAYTSHLVHLVAAALSSAVGGADADVGRVVGPGFVSTTRVAAGPPELWRQILDGNRDNVLAAMDAMRSELAAMEEAVKSGDGAALTACLDRGTVARRQVLLDAAVSGDKTLAMRPQP